MARSAGSDGCPMLRSMLVGRLFPLICRIRDGINEAARAPNMSDSLLPNTASTTGDRVERDPISDALERFDDPRREVGRALLMEAGLRETNAPLLGRSVDRF